MFFAGAPSVMDLRTGGYTGGGPEDDVLAAAATQLGRSFGLPVNMGTMATGAKEPGWQAAVDDALSTTASVLAGADMMSGCGLLDGSRTLSYPHLVMETEVYRIVQRLAEGIVVDEETLALDTIRRVGPQGTYLAEGHTRRHARRDLAPGRVGPHAVRRLAGRRPPRGLRRRPRAGGARSSPPTAASRCPTGCAPSWRRSWRGPTRSCGPECGASVGQRLGARDLLRDAVDAAPAVADHRAGDADHLAAGDDLAKALERGLVVSACRRSAR